MSPPSAVERLNTTDELSEWELERHLPTFSLQDIRFGRGFLRGDLSKLFSEMKALWLPMLSASTGAISVDKIEADFNFPGDLDQLQRIGQLESRALAALDFKRHHAAAAIHLGLCQIVLRMVGPEGIEHPRHLLLLALMVLTAPGLAVTTHVENTRVRLAGTSRPTEWSNRVTHVFRLEDGEWRLVHRHANRLEARYEPGTRLR